MTIERKVTDIPIIALDGVGLERVSALVYQFGHRVRALKVHDVVDTHGASALGNVQGGGGARVMVDFKYHDIPNTVGLRVKAMNNLHRTYPSILTVHASGGVAMMRAAKEAAHEKCEVYGITVLTSLSALEVHEMFGRNPRDQAMFLAGLAASAGLDGVVCSGQEVRTLSEAFPQMKFIVPGTRLPGASHGDQARVVTPLEALENGATHLVWGREIVGAADPESAFNAHMDNIRPFFTEPATQAQA